MTTEFIVQATPDDPEHWDYSSGVGVIRCVTAEDAQTVIRLLNDFAERTKRAEAVAQRVPKIAQVLQHYGDRYDELPVLDVRKGAHGWVVEVGCKLLAEK